MVAFWSIADEIRQEIRDRLPRFKQQLQLEETCDPRQKWSPLDWQKEVRGLASALYALGDPIEDLQPTGTLYDPAEESAGGLKTEVVEFIETLRQLGKLPQPPAGRAPRRDESTALPVLNPVESRMAINAAIAGYKYEPDESIQRLFTAAKVAGAAAAVGIVGAAAVAGLAGGLVCSSLALAVIGASCAVASAVCYFKASARQVEEEKRIAAFDADVAAFRGDMQTYATGTGQYQLPFKPSSQDLKGYAQSRIYLKVA